LQRTPSINSKQAGGASPLGIGRAWTISAVAVVLWLAAVGKSVQIIREPMLPDRWSWTLLVIAELLLGLLLVLGRRDRRVWLLAGSPSCCSRGSPG
jgi:uncharacterized membrane protein YphA (DoxX/SURF4 family)